MRITLDIETRSECDLTRAGGWEYSKHPTTEILCLAWKSDTGLSGSFFFDFEGAPEDGDNDREIQKFRNALARKPQMVAHNSGFEYAHWVNKMIPEHGFPEIPEQDWYCTAALAASYGLPRDLDRANRSLNLKEVKDRTGHRLMMKLCKPRPIWKRDGTGDKYFGTPDEHRRNKAYCVQDVNAEEALDNALEPLPPKERALWLMDQRINRRGVYCDRELVTAAMGLAEDAKAEGRRALTELTGGEVTAPTQVAKLRDWINDFDGMPPLSNMSASTVQTVLTDWAWSKSHPIYKALEIRRANSKASVGKYQAMFDRMGDDDRIRETMIYHGARTGRWKGRAVQPHNFIKAYLKHLEIIDLIIPNIKDRNAQALELLSDSVNHALSNATRAALCAAPDHTLYCADYSRIEACVTFWMANDTGGLAKLNSGVDLYVDMAATIYGIPVDLVTKKQRALGKVAILGLGYQMGWKRFFATCEEWGVEITVEMAKHTVNVYRQQYSAVVDWWSELQDHALAALSNGQSGPFTFKDKWLHCKLPSGRYLHYYDPKAAMNEWGGWNISYMGVDSKTKQWTLQYSYGGKLAENIVQSAARDIMAEAMLRCESRGYPLVMSVHDELISEVRKGQGDLQKFIQIMTEKPLWAEGCPITASGWEGQRYRKD